MGTITKGLISKDDLKIWDGVNSTFTRKTSSGATATYSVIDMMGVDILSVYGDSSTARDRATIVAAQSGVGSSNSAGFFLSVGTWTIDDDLTINGNTPLVIPAGAVLSVASGKTLTINAPVTAVARQIFSGAGDVVLGIGSTDGALPQWWGALADGTTDDGTAINNCADACRINSIPIKFLPGTYYTTASLNFTGANNDNAGYTMGWTIYGCGPEATQIYGNLSGAYAIVDLSDCEQSTIRDINVNGHANGSQICGVLHGMIGSALALRNRIVNCLIGGTYSEAGHINVSADLSIISDSYIYGPCGCIITSDKAAITGSVIASEHVTLTASPNCTLLTIRDSTIIGIGGDTMNWDAAIVQHEFEQICLVNSYIAQDDSATSGIRVEGATGGQTDSPRLNLVNCRYENQSNENGTFLWNGSDQPLRSCEIDCFVGTDGSPDAGQMIYLESSDLQGSIIKLKPVAAASWAHFVQRSGSTHLIEDCEILEGVDPATMKDGTDAALFGAGNIIHLYDWNASWAGVADGNTFFTSSPDSSGHGLVQKSYLGFNAVGKTTSLARRFTGSVISGSAAVASVAGAGDDVLATYTLPGDIGYCNSAQNICTLKITVFGLTAANANAKTLKVSFGTSGSETVMVTNDQTASPNDAKWYATAEITRMDISETWYYVANMVVDNVTQTTGVGSVTSDPAVATIKLNVTVDAAADDATMYSYRIEIF